MVNASIKWARLIPELVVSDLEASLLFYRDRLGFTVLYDRSEERFAMLDKEGAQIMLEEKGEGRHFTNGFPSHPYGQGINFQIEIDDVDGLYEDLLTQDTDIFCPIEEKWYRTGEMEAGNRQFVVADPDGYLLRFFTDLGERPVQND
jgi:catechol 2,3-dioxygenase-like lactoylglutathione lyase family enzyme